MGLRNKYMSHKGYFYLMPTLPLCMARGHHAHTECVRLAVGQHANPTG